MPLLLPPPLLQLGRDPLLPQRLARLLHDVGKVPRAVLAPPPALVPLVTWLGGAREAVEDARHGGARQRRRLARGGGEEGGKGGEEGGRGESTAVS